jgi:hypothetical protein
MGGFFMTTKPDRARCSAIRSAAIRTKNSSACWARRRPLAHGESDCFGDVSLIGARELLGFEHTRLWATVMRWHLI